MTKQYAISQQNKQSQSIDTMLDYIRDNKLHPIIDFIASYIVMIICIIYYFVSFLNTIHINKTTSDITSTNTYTKHGNFVISLIKDFVRCFVAIISKNTRENTPILVPLVTHERTLSIISHKMERIPTSTLLSYISTLRDEVSQIELEFYDSYKTERNTNRSNEKSKEISLISPTFIRIDGDCDSKGYDDQCDNDDNKSEDSFVVVEEERPNINEGEFHAVQSKEETDVHDCTSSNATLEMDFEDNTSFILNIRSSLSLRQIATRFVSKYQTLLDIENECKQRQTIESPKQMSFKYETQQRLYIRLKSVWVDLLRFPSLGMLTNNFESSASENKQPITIPVASVSKIFDISVIIPAYRERGDKIAFLLYRALQDCANPTTIQIIIVHADNTCPDLALFVNESIITDTSGSDDDNNNKDIQHSRETKTDSGNWGEVRIIQYNNGGGRGPCLNAGANVATGTILTFLHSDTILPVNWDQKIRNVFLLPKTVNNSQNTPVYHACVFRYGIDTSVSGLDGMKFPWGIRSVTILGRLRSWLCRLPYGDHVISIPASCFQYIGGYPNQPMMEDYDFVDLLRHRSTIHALNEQLYIIPGRPVLCSPRRWQKFGVFYCTGVNAVLVYRYTNGIVSPQDVYDYYYNRQPSQPSSITTKLQSDTRTERKVQ